MSSSKVVLSEVRQDGVAIVTLNRPTRGNAYTSEMQEMIFNVLDELAADARVKVIILTGAGKMFCVGADKDELTGINNSKKSVEGGKAKSGKGEPKSVVMFNRDVKQTQILRVPKPIICVVNGAAAGLGLVTSLMCDLRFAVADAKFTTSFARRGLIAEHGIAWALPRVVGLANATDLLLSGRVITAQEALAMGLVNRVYPDLDSCMKAALEYAVDVATWCSPVAMAEMKEQLYSRPTSPEEDIDRATDLMTRSFSHPDFAEGVKALVVGKPPNFQGFSAGRIRNLARM